MTATANCNSSPYASEFLPEEIHRLEAGTMVVCAACFWPRPTDAACDKCAAHNADRDRDGPGDRADTP